MSREMAHSCPTKKILGAKSIEYILIKNTQIDIQSF
jgi:hypothetical protein